MRSTLVSVVAILALGCGPAAGFIVGNPRRDASTDASPASDQGVPGVRDASIQESDTLEIDVSTVDVSTVDVSGVDVSTVDVRSDVADVPTVSIPDVHVIPLDAPDPSVPLPVFTPAVTARIMALRAMGTAMGSHANVFAKLGDSITESGSFLYDCGMGYGTLGTYGSLQSTLTYFSLVTFPDPDPTAGRTNSFDRHSLCAMGGWDTTQAITDYLGESSPRLVQELNAIHPAWALVEYGTNDVLENGDLWGTPGAHPELTFESNLITIVSMIEARGVVPVLYTIPPLLPLAVAGTTHPTAVMAGVQTVNDIIRGLAATDSIPLIDFWVALTALPSPHGINPTDGIHPTAYNGSDACNFTEPALSSGYNVRNLITVQMLARLQAM